MSIRPYRDIKRRKTRVINVGDVKIGGNNPISVQSMTNTLTTDIKATINQINDIAKEGADGLLGMAIEHPDYPKGLGIVVKIAHGWNSQATWYVARALLGVLGINLRNPYPLHRQKAFIVPGIVPEAYVDILETVPTWDEWDPDQDRWNYETEV